MRSQKKPTTTETHQPLKRYFEIEVDLYNQTVLFCTEPTFEDLKKNFRMFVAPLKEHNHTEAYIDTVLKCIEERLLPPMSVDNVFGGITTTMEAVHNAGFTRPWLVWIPMKHGLLDGRVPETISHEFYHVARKIIHKVGVRESDASAGEATAYLLGYMVRTAWTYLVRAGYPLVMHERPKK